MKQCTACDRHLFGEEPSCPFCGAEQRSTLASPSASPTAGSVGSMLASVTLALGLGVMSCGPGVQVETTDASSGSDTEPSSTSTTTVGPTSSSTSGVTTDDGPTTTTVMTTADADTTDDSVGSFYAVRPDGPFGPECDLFAQDCPESEKCMPWANDGGGTWNDTRCSPIADAPGQEDDPCAVEGSATSGIDDCDLGLMCFYVDPATNEGSCVSLCQGSAVAPTCPGGPPQFCAIDGVLSLCLDSCDPLMPACPVGSGCYPFEEAFVCAPTTAEGMYGDACSLFTDCALDHVCLDQSAFPDCMSAGCCSVYCDVTAPETCPEAMLGATCQAWYVNGLPPPGLENVGACALPL